MISDVQTERRRIGDCYYVIAFSQRYGSNPPMLKILHAHDCENKRYVQVKDKSAL